MSNELEVGRLRNKTLPVTASGERAFLCFLRTDPQMSGLRAQLRERGVGLEGTFDAKNGVVQLSLQVPPGMSRKECVEIVAPWFGGCKKLFASRRQEIADGARKLPSHVLARLVRTQIQHGSN